MQGYPDRVSFGLTFEKLFLIAIIAVILLGPDRLPYYASQLARLVRSLKDMATGARERMREEMGPEFDDIDWKKLDPAPVRPAPDHPRGPHRRRAAQGGAAGRAVRLRAAQGEARGGRRGAVRRREHLDASLSDGTRSAATVRSIVHWPSTRVPA